MKTELQTDKPRQRRCQASHSVTPLSRPPVASKPGRASAVGTPGEGALSTLLISAFTALLSGVTNHHESNQVGLGRLSVHPEGEGGRGSWRGFIFLSLCFFLSQSSLFPPSPLLYLHSAIFSPSFCPCPPF